MESRDLNICEWADMVYFRISWDEFQIMINPPPPPKPPTPHKEMLALTLPNGNLMGNGVKQIVEEKKEEDTK